MYVMEEYRKYQEKLKRMINPKIFFHRYQTSKMKKGPLRKPDKDITSLVKGKAGWPDIFPP